jgi:predicted peptidase
LYLSSMRKITLTLLLLYVTAISLAQDSSLYEKKEFIRDNDTLRYRILYPQDYKATKKYPLILLLHGAGERGNDNKAQLIHGSTLFTDPANRQQYPAIVIFPQCPRNDFWARIDRDPNRKDSLNGLYFPSERPIGKSLGLVSQLLDSLVAAKKVNTQKIYVGGLSMGGMGTFEILWRKPGFFAAAFPICGGGDPAKVKEYGRKFPIWVFHGDNDNTVLPSHSRLMVNALKAAGTKVKYTEYPGVGHNSWDNAFKEPDLMKWLFEQKKK